MDTDRYLQITKHYGSTDGTVAGIPDPVDRAGAKRIIAREQANALEPTNIFKKWNSPPSCPR
jgi:hypothetical protein